MLAQPIDKTKVNANRMKIDFLITSPPIECDYLTAPIDIPPYIYGLLVNIYYSSYQNF